jgi:hypothetical protein
MDHDPAHIVIELDPGSEPISGNVRAAAQPPQPFTGWTGLFAVLRAVAGDVAGGDGRTGHINPATPEGSERT